MRRSHEYGDGNDNHNRKKDDLCGGRVALLLFRRVAAGIALSCLAAAALTGLLPGRSPISGS